MDTCRRDNSKTVRGARRSQPDAYSLRAPRRVKASSAQCHPHGSVLLRGPMDGHRVRAREALRGALSAGDAGSKVRNRSLQTRQRPSTPLDHTSRLSFRERPLHHHATLCIVAYGFLIAERSRFTPRSALDRSNLPHATFHPTESRLGQTQRHNSHSIAALRNLFAKVLAGRLPCCPLCCTLCL